MFCIAAGARQSNWTAWSLALVAMTNSPFEFVVGFFANEKALADDYFRAGHGVAHKLSADLRI
jgi:hypothetical protein